MLKLDDNGFLGEGADNWSHVFKNDHRSLLDRCERLNRDAHSLLFSVKIDTKDQREVIIKCLFVRALEFYQAAILLIEKGMQLSAKGVLRCLLEAIFLLRAVDKDGTALQEYVASDETERLKTLNKAQHNDTPNMQLLQKENLNEIKGEIKQRIDEKGIKSVSIEDYARKAGMHNWYVDIYPSLSMAAHSSPRDLEQHLLLGSGGQVRELQYGPTDSEASGLLIHGSHCLFLGIVAIVNVFKHNLENKDDLKETFEGHETFFREKMDELNAQNPLDRTDAARDSSQPLIGRS